VDNFTLIAIGGSAGALSALRQIVPRLPDDLNAAICLVLHVSPESPGVIPDVLSRAGALSARTARDGEALRPGRIYVAAPDRHLLVRLDGTLRLGAGPKENLFRPAVDPLFRSVAAFGRHSVGIVLSGGLDDGAAGLATMKAAGAVTIVQDPKEASVPSMPRAALQSVDADYCLPADAIADRLVSIVRAQKAQPKVSPMATPSNHVETEIADGVSPQDLNFTTLGTPSMQTCPSCSGVLIEMTGKPLRFRCHTGHAFTAQTLAALVADEADATLWSALRALQEKQMLLTRLASQGDGEPLSAAAQRTHRLVESLREILESDDARNVELVAIGRE
jgi:two-component system chemotaxis response regulator CheB